MICHNQVRISPIPAGIGPILTWLWHSVACLQFCACLCSGALLRPTNSRKEKHACILWQPIQLLHHIYILPICTSITTRNFNHISCLFHNLTNSSITCYTWKKNKQKYSYTNGTNLDIFSARFLVPLTTHQTVHHTNSKILPLFV